VQHVRDGLALQGLVELGERYQHAGMALTQVTLQAFAMLDERREHQAGQLAFVQARERLSTSCRQQLALQSTRFGDQRNRYLSSMQVVRRLTQEPLDAMFVGEFAQALGLQPMHMRHE